MESVTMIKIFLLVLVCNDVLSASDILRKVIAKSCSSVYTMGCFKMDMVQLVNYLEENKRVSLMPGVHLTLDNITEDTSVNNEKLPEKLVRSLARNFPHGDSSELDEYLIDRVSGYIRRHSLSLQFGEVNQETSTKEDVTSSGRGKGGKGGYGGLIAAALMMKGMLATLGMGAVAALAGKALMTGLMSLMLSAIIGLKSASGGGHKQTTYEIISKPVYSHSHSHSSEVQHDHGGGGGHAGYSYGRNLDMQETGKKNEKVTRTSEVQYINLDKDEEEEQVEYKTITEEDLKDIQKFGNYYNKIDYGALSGGSQTHESYRNGRNIVAETSTLRSP